MNVSKDSFDAYYKKIIQYKFRNRDLRFYVSQTLFSSYAIDSGTHRLLQTLAFENLDVVDTILDLGCGYGPIGIALKSVNPSCTVHMVDRDALAVDYSRQNATLNRLNDIQTYASLGYDDVKKTDFDLIVSNIPARVGKRVLSHILEDARFYMKPDGRIAVVVTDTIAEFATEVLTAHPAIDILFQKTWPSHSVFHYKFSPFPLVKPITTAFDQGTYDRGEKIILLGSIKVCARTAYGLPEFTTLSFETDLLLKGLSVLKNKEINSAIIFNPGQGFVPLALSTLSKVNNIILVDRDLLALRVSKRNLMLNNYPSGNISLLHQADLTLPNPGKTDCVLGVLREEDGPKVHAIFLQQALAQLTQNGLMLCTSSSTAITRLESIVHHKKLLTVLERRRLKGKSILILKRN